MRPPSRDGTRSDVPSTKSHNPNAKIDTMITWVYCPHKRLVGYVNIRIVQRFWYRKTT